MRKRSPDIAKARSLVIASEREMAFLDTLDPAPEAASTIIRGIYENFRRLGSAVLLLQGLAGDHEQEIHALIQLNPQTTRPVQILDTLRRLRHDINYRGYQPSESDLRDVLSIREACWDPVLRAVKKKLE